MNESEWQYTVWSNNEELISYKVNEKKKTKEDYADDDIVDLSDLILTAMYVFCQLATKPMRNKKKPGENVNVTKM